MHVRKGRLLGTFGFDAEEVEGLGLDRCRSSVEDELVIVVEGRGGDVAGQGGERGEQALEAQNRQAVLGAPFGLLGAGGGRALGLGDDALPLRLGGLSVGLVVEHGRQLLAHVPLDVIGEHAQEDMRPNPRCEAVVERPDLQIDGLERAKGAFHLGERLAGAHRPFIAEGILGQAGADHVDAVQRRLVNDGLGVAGKGEMFGGDGGEIALIEQRELRQPPSRWRLASAFSIRLPSVEPVEGAVERILVDFAEAEDLAQAGGGGQRRERLGGGEFRRWRSQSGHDHGDHQSAVAMAGGTEEAIEADGSKGAEDGGDMAVGQRPLDGEDGLILGNDGAALEQGLEAFDQLGRPVGEIEQGAFFDLAVV